MINMEFITSSPRTQRHHDSIWVIVYSTKSMCFLAVKRTYSAEDYANFYIKEMVRLYVVSFSVISNRCPQFTFHLWKSFEKCLGTQVNLSTIFHPQMDGKVENTIHTLK